MKKTDLLNDLKTKQVSELQVHKWKSAIRSELKKSDPKIKWYHVAAASVMGILIGGVAMMQFMKTQYQQNSPEPARIERGDATIEYAFYKSE